MTTSIEPAPQLTTQLLTVPEVAARLHIHERTVFTHIAMRHLPVVKIGRCLRISETDLARFIAERTQPAVRVWDGR